MSAKSNITLIRVPRMSRLLDKKAALEQEAARIRAELIEIDNEIKAQVPQGYEMASKLNGAYVKVIHVVSERVVLNTAKLKIYLEKAGLLKRFQTKVKVTTLSVVEIDKDEWIEFRDAK